MHRHAATLFVFAFGSVACGGGDDPKGAGGSGNGGSSTQGGSSSAGKNGGGSASGAAPGGASSGGAGSNAGGTGSGGEVTLGEPFAPSRLASGNAQNCVITKDQALYCWGSGSGGGKAKYTQVSNQTEHCCAVDTTGKVDCFESSPLQAAIPQGTFKEVRVAVHGACARDMQDKLTCWSDGNESAAALVTDVPTEAVKTFYVSSDTGCAVLSSGATKCWGFDPGSMVRTMPPRTDFLVIGGNVTMVGIAPDGSLVGFGLGSLPDIPPGKGYVHVAVGDGHIVGLRADGTITSSGQDAMPAPAGVKFVEVSAGDGQTCGITSAGNVVCWGNDTAAWFESPPENVKAF